jgi:hypothetical protein
MVEFAGVLEHGALAAVWANDPGAPQLAGCQNASGQRSCPYSLASLNSLTSLTSPGFVSL